uniref:F-box domain-containing protein n=1 Tax=Bionectria ochroleuca TaxID=29856 RepID=A0A0B7K5T9_BIOOC
MGSEEGSTNEGPTMASREENQLLSAFQLLAVELQHKIIPHLDPIGLVSLSQSCRYFRRLIDPGRKEFAERLLQVECLERYGGTTLA